MRNKVKRKLNQLKIISEKITSSIKPRPPVTPDHSKFPYKEHVSIFGFFYRSKMALNNYYFCDNIVIYYPLKRISNMYVT